MCNHVFCIQGQNNTTQIIARYNLEKNFQFHLLGFNEYANFLTKFDILTAKTITGNPINWTGSSMIGCCAKTLSGVSINPIRIVKTM